MDFAIQDPEAVELWELSNDMDYAVLVAGRCGISMGFTARDWILSFFHEKLPTTGTEKSPKKIRKISEKNPEYANGTRQTRFSETGMSEKSPKNF